MSETGTKARATPMSLSPLREWRFHCPECGFGDQELGHKLTEHEIFCDVCIGADTPTQVRLRRWREDPDG